uniref:Acyl-coenzyme A oxidase n=1 Tax=Saccoglossus kowalevskii TaxID=10224 RepID=A0ABM0MUW8_SACKO|nr:PREDICTED: peroxisomal acyl-coenzyme A oxidase 1-like [Saccoglossus kowalevskii]
MDSFHPVPVKVNPDLQKERDAALFNPVELTYLKDGGKDKTERRRRCELLAINDPDLQHKDISFMARNERYSNAVRKAVIIARKIKEHRLTNMEEKQLYISAATQYDTYGFGLHYGMFLPALSAQCDEEQRNYWLPLAENLKILGTYAQTELGHGTFIRGLETTAIYDPKTEEFVLHTPTLSALKWWPGNMGKTATHAVVLAQLYTNGKSYGLHPFIVQLRSLENHQPLPGITLGDIGPKLGFHSFDNGFLGFDHVRIPRRNMLMKYSQVSPDGFYIKPIHAKLTYSTMVEARVTLVSDIAYSLSQAVTIAVRYSAVRRQTEQIKGVKEPQILDYRTQQLKLFPYLAAAYAFTFTSFVITGRYIEVQNEMNDGNMESLSELHALSAGLKAFTSYVGNEGIEVCRLSCGGHGYSQASGFPELYTLTAPISTFEGENTVMLLQTARYLMKCATTAKRGLELPRFVLYLSQRQKGQCPARNESDLLDHGLLSDAFEHRARRLVIEAAQKMQSNIGKGNPQHVAWNNCHMYLLKAASAHCHFYVVQTFVKYINDTEMSDAVRDILTSLCQFYALHGIWQNAGDFLQDGYMNGNQLDMVQSLVGKLLDKIRINAVALVDAFDFRDEILCSKLGKYDGNVYEAMYEWAKNSPLNKTEVHDSYNKYLRPLMQSSKAKL